MSTLISIIIPVYNVEQYLHECLESVLAQTYSNLEIIVVDDGSTDSSSRICDEFAVKDSRIRVVHQRNKGLSDARNAGIALAKGSYICFLDSDDAIHPEFVAALYTACTQTGSDIAVCRFASDKSEWKRTTSDIKIFDNHEISLALCSDATGTLGVVWNKLYARHLFDSITFPAGRIHEDEATTYLFFWESQRIALVSDVLHFYRLRENSLAHSAFSPRRMDAALAYRERIEFYEQRSEQTLADYTRAVYCHFLRKYLRDIRAGIDDAKYWEREMRTAFTDVLRSPRVTLRKKLSLSLQMISPESYTRCKAYYHRLTNRK